MWKLHPRLVCVQEAARVALERCCCNKRITRVDALEQGGGVRDGQFDDFVFQVEGPEDLEKALAGRTIRHCHRKGKNLWLEFDEPPHIAWHFGMTGAFLIKGERVPVYTRITFSGESWPPKFTKVRIYFEDGTELAYVDGRRLGKVRIQNDPPHESPIADLALDPVLDEPTDEKLAEICGKANTAIKNVLLDQERAYCGIGNWLADEVLYQSGIHPAVLASALTPQQITRLRETVARVCRTAVAAEGDADKFPEDWLFHHRWDKRSKAPKQTVDGHPITFLTVGGRTSAIVLARQSPRGVAMVDTEPIDVQGETKPNKSAKRKTASAGDGPKDSKKASKPSRQTKRGKSSATSPDVAESKADDDDDDDENPTVVGKKKRGAAAASKAPRSTKKKAAEVEEAVAEAQPANTKVPRKRAKQRG